MQKHVSKMLGRMERSAREKRVVHMHPLIKACNSDIINSYAFDDNFNFLDREDCGQTYYQSIDVFFKLSHVFGHFTWFADLVHNLPMWMLVIVAPKLREMYTKKSVRVFTHFFGFDRLANMFVYSGGWID